ncbi:hypothetical protein [Empedobacter brevis]|uniref:hypothetical protein n=1 Tax=Empedobacter brevis TaxID=247 RepID=UPI0028A5BC69|nr:hypothetical protein [Empedobacter brevis]
MELTGKAKEEFRLWLFNEHDIKHKFHDEIPDRLLVSYVVEWFETQNAITIDKDTVNTRMIVTDWNGQEEVQHIIDCTYEELTKSGFTNWWKQAIIKANEIYNERFK